MIPRLFYADTPGNLMVHPGENEGLEVRCQQICATCENYKIEQDRERNIIMAPVRGEAFDQNSKFIMQLRLGAKRNGLGRVFDSSAGPFCRTARSSVLIMLGQPEREDDVYGYAMESNSPS